MDHFNLDLHIADWLRDRGDVSLNNNINFCQSNFISFSLGLPDNAYFPTDAIREAAREIFSSKHPILQYHPPLKILKKQLVAIMAFRGVHCHEEQIVITNGAQQALMLIAQLLLDHQSPVLTETLTYTGFLDAVKSLKPRFIDVPRSKAGLDLSAVKNKMQAEERPRLFYLVADGNNPLGTSIPIHQRMELANYAEEYHVPLVEDDPYGFLHYDMLSPAPIKKYSQDWVFYVGTLSKIIVPSMRIGWLVVPEQIVPLISQIKETHDLNIAGFSHWLVQEMLVNFDLESHISLLIKHYRKKRDIMVNALKEHLPDDAYFEIPSCGFFIWITVPGIDSAQLQQLALSKYQLAIVSAQVFCSVNRSQKMEGFRINFSYPSLEKIEEGVLRLSRAIQDIRRIESRKQKVFS